MKRLFNKLNGREQLLLLILIWSALLFPSGCIVEDIIGDQLEYNEFADRIEQQEKILSLREGLEKKIELRLQGHQSFSRSMLQNIAHKVATNVDSKAKFVADRPRPLGDLFAQHTVIITFKNVRWEQLTQYANEIRSRQNIFLSEVEIKPRYVNSPRGRYLDKDSFIGIFHVSSLELKK